MASIERLQTPIQAGSNPMGKGIQEQVVPTTSFSQILGDLQQLISPFASSLEQMKLAEEGSQEMPEWTEEQWQDIYVMLNTLLQVLEQAPETISGLGQNGINQPNIQQWLVSQQALQSTGLKLEKGNVSSISEVLALIHTMNEDGTAIPREVSVQFQKIMEFLDPSITKKEVDKPPVEWKNQSRELNRDVTWQLGQESSAFRFVPVDQAQSVAVEGINSGMEKVPDAPFPGALPIFSGSGLHRLDPQQVKPNAYVMHSDNFVSEMTEFLVSKIKISPLSGGTEARVSLYPEHLGQLDMRISLQQGQMVAQFIAENATARDMLESNLSALRSALQQQGIQVSKIDIQTAEQAGLMNQHQQPQNQSGSYQQNQKSKRSVLGTGIDRLGKGEGAAVYDHMQSFESAVLQPSDKNIDFSA